MHDLRRVAEPLTHCGGAQLIHEVRPQRLVAALGGLRGLGEVLAAGSHSSGDLSELPAESVV